MEQIRSKIEQIIADQVEALRRPDLFRAPIVAVSSVKDPRYSELKEIIGEWHLAPAELLPDAQSVISYFVPFTKEVVADPRTASELPTLWAEAYVVINKHFDRIGEVIVDYLNSQGYSALQIAGTHTYDPQDLKSMWSHRSAAAIAGLGTFGANRLLITEKGSGGRFCTILTSAPLEVSRGLAEERCLYQKSGACGLCFQSCPVGALKPGQFDRFTCNEEVLLKNAEKLSELGFCDVCGKCISACPFSYIESCTGENC